MCFGFVSLTVDIRKLINKHVDNIKHFKLNFFYCIWLLCYDSIYLSIVSNCMYSSHKRGLFLNVITFRFFSPVCSFFTCSQCDLGFGNANLKDYYYAIENCAYKNQSVFCNISIFLGPPFLLNLGTSCHFYHTHISLVFMAHEPLTQASNNFSLPKI